jgi:hypothetical protein
VPHYSKHPANGRSIFTLSNMDTDSIADGFTSVGLIGWLVLLVCFVSLGILAVVLTPTTKSVSGRIPQTHEERTFHDQPSADRLPATLDPAQFQDNRGALVAYTLAGQIEQTLYQVPCYCGCDKEQGHRSLLDCFTGKHGTLCHICQKEVIFCFLAQKKGKSAAQIRTAMAKGNAAKLDLNKYVKRLYAQMHSGGKPPG